MTKYLEILKLVAYILSDKEVKTAITEIFSFIKDIIDYFTDEEVKNGVPQKTK